MRKHGGMGGFSRVAEKRKKPPAPSSQRLGDSGANRHIFAIEALEPRLLLSADLNVAAGTAIISGLQALDSAVHHLNATTALSAETPFVNRTLADLAALGDPVATIESAAQAYLTGNSSASIGGLAAALGQISTANVAASATTNGSVESITVTLAAHSSAPLVFDLSASGDGHTLAGPNAQTLNETQSQSLNLTFGVDVATGAFQLSSAAIGSNIELKSSNLAGAVVFDGTNATATSGDANIVANVAATFAAPQGGSLSLADLQNQPVNAIATTSVGGHAFLETVLASGTPAKAEYVSENIPDIANLSSAVFDPNPVTPSPLQAQVDSAFGDLINQITQIETSLNGLNSTVGDLPFIGNSFAQALNPSALFQPILSELSSLQSKVDQDLASTATLLTQVQQDIVSGLSLVGLLPGTAANDVTIYYQTSGGPGGSITGGSASPVDLTSVTQLELDLKLGQSVTKTLPVGADLGLPGLGLQLTPGSTLNATIGWTFNLGLGFGSAANSVYLVSGASAADKTSPLNFNVTFNLGDGFQAVGTMGFMQALLTEPSVLKPGDPPGKPGTIPTAADHTGVYGGIGVTLGGMTGGSALDGGSMINVADITKLTATPDFSLATKSALHLAFGADFQKQQNGNYAEVSSFPSFSADLKFNWTLTGDSVANSPTAPDVGLENIQFNIGTAVTNLLAPVLKPIYDATHGMQDVIKFLTTTVPIIGNIVEGASSYGIPDLVLNQYFPSYSHGDTYDWIHFAADRLGLSPSDNKAVVKIAEAAINLVLQVDQMYGDIQNSSSLDLSISLGNLDFTGKNLRLPQLDATAASQLTDPNNVARVANFAGMDAATAQAAAAQINSYIGGMGSLLGGGAVASFLGSAGGDLAKLASDADAALNTALSVANPGADSGVTTHSVADFTLPFLSNPSSLIGILFGQNVQFFNLSLGFSADFKMVQPIAELDFFGIVQAVLGVDITATVGVGLQVAYDATGLQEILSHHVPNGETSAQALLDGLKFGPNALFDGTPLAGDVLALSAKFGVSLSAQLLEGLASAGLEGGVGLSFQAKLAGSTPASPFVNANQIAATESLYTGVGGETPEQAGIVGPLMLTANGYAYLDFVYKTFWGFGPSGSDTIANVNIFSYPNPQPNPADIGPLGFYNPNSQTLTLYTGPLTSQRNVNNAAPGETPPTPGSSLDNANNAADIAAANSANYSIDVHNKSPGDTQNPDYVTISWTDPKTGITETQSVSGPVKLIVADTGAGNDTIKVTNTDPNDTKVKFTGGSGQNADSTAATINNGQNKTAGSAGLPGDIGPLGYYNPQSQTLQLYTGTLADDRDHGAAIAGGGGPAIYNLSIGANGIATITWTNPKTGVTETQTTSGAVKSVIADTSNGDSVNVNNNASGATINLTNDPASVSGAPIGGNNIFYSAQGDATLKGGGGNNILYGGPGNDSIVGGGGATTIYSGGGNDTILGGAGTNLIYAGAGNLNITGGPSNDTIVVVGAGNSSFDGGGGVNTLDYSQVPAGVNVNLATGIATGSAIGTEQLTNFNVIDGGAFASTLVGGTAAQGSDTINGGSGGDSIVGGGGNDVIHGNTPSNPAYHGNNITGGSGNDTIYGGNAHDTILAGSGNDSIIGGSGGSSIDGGTGNSTIYGGIGNDTISAADGNNLIDTGDGADSVNVGNGANTVTAGHGNDTITAGNGANTVYSGTGDETIVAGDGNNNIVGNIGNDSIAVGNGANTIYGGIGTDVITAGIGSNSIDGGTGNDSIIAGQMGVGASTTIGGTGANSIIGGNGNTTIRAGDGANTIFGGTGADLIVAGAGNNTILGGTGKDTIAVGDGANSIVGGNGDDSITAGNGANRIWGNNSIYGGAGADTITVGNGNNTIYGGTGNNVITAGNGNNIILGGIGSDTIQTGTGDNTITGGTVDLNMTTGPAIPATIRSPAARSAMSSVFRAAPMSLTPATGPIRSLAEPAPT